RSRDKSHYGIEFMPDAQRRDKLPLTNVPGQYFLSFENGRKRHEEKNAERIVPRPTDKMHCRTGIRISTQGFERLAPPPVAKYGRLQRLRRLHHQYLVLISADRLDVEQPSLPPPRSFRSSTQRMCIIIHSIRCQLNSRKSRTLLGLHTEISRNRAETKGKGKEEEEEKKKKKKQFYCEVFRGSWRKKMGKVFICGLPLRSGPMAVLNRSQLRGVGVILPFAFAGSRPAEEQPVDLTRLPKIRLV
ncbi:hypothetical protein ALC62_04962, partial [Cyphomyrmex costatus]